MGVIFGLAVVGALLAVPFLVGRRVESGWGGLVGLSILPIAVAVFGFAAYLSDANSSDAETRDWAGLLLIIPIFAGILEVVGAVSWSFGRLLRHAHDRREAELQQVRSPKW